jgi:hypothetical protein
MSIKPEQNINLSAYRKTTAVILKKICIKSISRSKKSDDKTSTDNKKKRTISFFPTLEKKATLKSLCEIDLKSPLIPSKNSHLLRTKHELFVSEKNIEANFKKKKKNENKNDFFLMKGRNYFKREKPARHIHFETSSISIINSDRSNYKANSMTVDRNQNEKSALRKKLEEQNNINSRLSFIDARDFSIKSLIRNYMQKAKTKNSTDDYKNNELDDYLDQESEENYDKFSSEEISPINRRKTKKSQPYLNAPNKRITLSNHFFEMADEICKNRINNNFRKGLNIANLEKKTTFRDRVLASMKEKKQQDFNYLINDFMVVQEKKAKRMSFFDNSNIINKKQRIDAIRKCMITTFEYLFRLQINLNDVNYSKNI